MVHAEQIMLLSNIAAAILREALNDSPLCMPSVSFRFCYLDTCTVKLEWLGENGIITSFTQAYQTSILPSYKPQDVAEIFIDRAMLRSHRVKKQLNKTST